MKWSHTSCYLFEMFSETVPQMFHNTSIWLTLALAVQRYLYVCQATRYCLTFSSLAVRNLDRIGLD